MPEYQPFISFYILMIHDVFPIKSSMTEDAQMISIVMFHPGHPGPGKFLRVFLLPRSGGTKSAKGCPKDLNVKQRIAARSRRGEEVRVKNANFVFVQSYWVASSLRCFFRCWSGTMPRQLWTLENIRTLMGLFCPLSRMFTRLPELLTYGGWKKSCTSW